MVGYETPDLKAAHFRAIRRAGFADIDRNLRVPLRGIGAGLSVAVRTGDTPQKERAAMRDLMVGAFSVFRNTVAHQEVKFDEPREVVDMICFANQLLRMIARI